MDGLVMMPPYLSTFWEGYFDQKHITTTKKAQTNITNSILNFSTVTGALLHRSERQRNEAKLLSSPVRGTRLSTSGGTILTV